MATKQNIQTRKPKQAKAPKVLQIVEPTKKNEVRYDLQTALAPLFQPVNDVAVGERPKRTVRRELKNGWIEFKCFEGLSIFDESVALAIMRIAAEKERAGYLSDSPKTDLGKEMRKILDPDNGMPGKSGGLVRETSINEICGLIGIKNPGKREYLYVRASLKRLSTIFISQRDEENGVETHGETGFIRHKIHDNGRLSVAFTYRLAMAAFGESGWMYALVSLDERNCLKGDIAKSAHKFLVSWLWREGSRPIRLDVLAGHVWWRWDSHSSNAKSTMRERLKLALAQINILSGWNLIINGRGSKAMVNVARGPNKTSEISREVD